MNKNKNRGYSLIETVVYVALIGTILIISTSSILSVYRIFGVLRTERKISLNGDITMETMIRDIRASSSAIATAQGSNILTIDSIVYTSNDSQQITKNAQTITGTDVRVTSLQFYKDTASNSNIVSVRMTIESGQGIYLRSKKYYGSAVLRGAYN